MLRLLVAAAALCAAACGRDLSPHIVFAGTPTPTSVEVRGLPSADLRRLADATLMNGEWQAFFRVSVNSGSQNAMAGEYRVDRDVVRFTPMFGFDAGRTFVATFDPARIPAVDASESWRRTPLTTTAAIAGKAAAASTVVSRVYPTGPVVPENMLRFYIEFSAPMGRGPALSHIKLLDDAGREVVDPFLPVEAELWSPDRTRFTLLFDPGRVKRGIKPNRDMGRALDAGRSYTLLIEAGWQDGNGAPLRAGFRHQFSAGPPVDAALDPGAWRIVDPPAGSRDPLIVHFPWPLDHGLLSHTLEVVQGSAPIPGSVDVRDRERVWTFTPAREWSAGQYALRIAPTLEDPAGNRIGRAFEVVDDGGAERSEPAYVAFRVK